MSASRDAPNDLLAALDAMAAPAYLLDSRWCAIGWNAPAAHLFVGWFDSGERSLLRYVFLAPSARIFISDWENRAARLVSEFRADIASHPNDFGQEGLIAELLRESPDFARLWAAHTVLMREGGLRFFDHPRDGPLRYEQITLVPSAHPGNKIVMLLRV